MNNISRNKFETEIGELIRIEFVLRLMDVVLSLPTVSDMAMEMSNMVKVFLAQQDYYTIIGRKPSTVYAIILSCRKKKKNLSSLILGLALLIASSETAVSGDCDTNL